MGIVEILDKAAGLYDMIEMIFQVIQGLGFVAYLLLIGSIVIPYVVRGYMIMCIGRKAQLDADWMPFIPIARQLYQMEIADCPWWYVFLFQNCFVNWAITALLLLLFINLIHNGVLLVLIITAYAVATLVFTFFYYRRYFVRFGFNPNTAWIEIIWVFFAVSSVLQVLVAFSDGIRFRVPGCPEDHERISPVAREQGWDQKAGMNGGGGENAGRNRSSAVITGVEGKYAGATFDIGNGDTVVFGRSSTDANIVFDQFETDVSRKHCAVRYDSASAQFVVTDYSTNGTYLENGTALTHGQPMNLPRGSVIYLGKNKKNSFRLG